MERKKLTEFAKPVREALEGLMNGGAFVLEDEDGQVRAERTFPPGMLTHHFVT